MPQATRIYEDWLFLLLPAALLRDPGFDPRFHLLLFVVVGQAKNPPLFSNCLSLDDIETIYLVYLHCIDVKIELLFFRLAAARLSSFQNVLRFLCEYFNSLRTIQREREGADISDANSTAFVYRLYTYSTVLSNLQA